MSASSLSHRSSYALNVAPEQQKQKTLQAILTMLRRAAQQPLLFVMEDMHWVDLPISGAA